MIAPKGLSRRTLVTAATTALAVPRAWALGNPFPTKPISMIVSLQAGSGSDLACRLVGEQLSRRLDISVVVENAPGAGGVVGAAKVFNARPDGYTLGALNNGLVCLVPNLPARPAFAIENMTPVAMLADLPSVMVISGSSTARTLAEFVSASTAEGSNYSYASVGMGSPQHVAMEQLKLATGAKMLHVPYRGGPQGVADVVSGQVQATWIAIPVAAPFIKSGQLRAIAVGGPRRSSTLPDVPTLREAGVTNFEYVPWIGLYAPPKTPQSVVVPLHTHIQDILGSEEVRTKFQAAGLEAKPMSAAQFEQRGISERRAMADVVKRIA